MKAKLRTNYGLEWSMKTINGGNNLQKTDIWMQERIKQKHRQKDLAEAANETNEKTIKVLTTFTELIFREIEYNFFFQIFPVWLITFENRSQFITIKTVTTEIYIHQKINWKEIVKFGIPYTNKQDSKKPILLHGPLLRLSNSIGQLMWINISSTDCCKF